MQTQNLFQRNGSWYIYIRVEGKRVRRSFGSDKNAALAALAEIQKRRALIKLGEMDVEEFRDTIRLKKNKLFREAAEEFLKEKSSVNRQNTMYDYRRMLDSYILPFIGHERIGYITEGHLVRMRGQLQSKLTARTVNKVLTLTGAIFKMAHRRKEIKENPMLHVKKCKTEKRKNNVLSLDQLQTVLELIPLQWKPIFIFMAYTGCRHNEAFALRWRDIKWAKGEIEICRGRARGVEGPPKTASSTRTLPMLPPVKACLEELRARTKVIGPDTHVFLSPRTKQPFNDTKAFNECWQRALAKAGLPKCRSYELRHTFASNMLEQGVPATYVSAILGHADLSTTFRAYASAISASDKRNRDMMANIIQGRHQSDAQG